jgi:nucleoside-diphosphate-sugar epimerase
MTKCRGRLGLGLLFFVVLMTSMVAGQLADSAEAPEDTVEENPMSDPVSFEALDVFLNESSVVLITGAAGFIGSELALALHRTYEVKKLILMDSMETMASKFKQSKTPEDATAGHRTEPDLALFEFRRQRVFRVLQAVGSKGFFYRTDIRPTIPEFFDQGEVPVLDLVFKQHPDITHVVHLADAYHRGNIDVQTIQGLERNELYTQAVPRRELEMKAGMMDAILEQLRLFGNSTGGKQIPHLTYASSYEVYNAKPGVTPEAILDRPNPPPFKEDKPITSPTTLGGASKLLDELLAKTYYELENIYSVGLRLFTVYGPWGVPGSPVFDMAERAAVGNKPLLTDNEKNTLDHLYDFVYIDDAVDALMTAMQFKPTTSDPDKSPAPVVINVGSGEPMSLRQIARRMQLVVPTAKIQGSTDEIVMKDRQLKAYASTTRAEELLGFKARIPLDKGLEQLVAWHFDRAFPYGDAKSTDNKEDKHDISKKGIVSCSRYDEECLKGMPVFPCASECAHSDQCLPSLYDDVLGYTRVLTEDCDVVMYTVALEEDLVSIPSSKFQISASSKSHVAGNGYCNIAFVSELSPLVQRIKRDNPSAGSDFHSRNNVLMNGFWALVPVTISKFVADYEHVLRLVPKLSPSLFFSSDVNIAIYADPDVIFDSIPALLEEVNMQPSHPKINGATAILIGKPRSITASSIPPYQNRSLKSSMQEQAYRMIRISVFDEMSEDGFEQQIDASFMVHALNNEDARLFRCDVFGEVVQWDVESDKSALEFILGLHDMWSNVITRKAKMEPWWHGDNVETISSGAYVIGAANRVGKTRRRLQEVATDGAGEFGLDEAEEEGESEDEDAEEEEDEDDDNDIEPVDQNVEDGKPKKRVPEETKEEEDSEDILDTSSYDTWLGVLSSSTTRYFARIVSWEAVGAVHLDDYASFD